MLTLAGVKGKIQKTISTKWNEIDLYVTLQSDYILYLVRQEMLSERLFSGGAQAHSESVCSNHTHVCEGGQIGGYLYDGLGQANLVLLDVQRLHPSPLLLFQDLTQLCGHFSLHREEPGNKSNTPFTYQS